MTNSILTKKDVFFMVLHLFVYKNSVFDFFNKILHTSIISERNIKFFVKVLV